MGTQDPTRRPAGDLSGLWRQVGEQLVFGQARFDARLDRLEGDVAVLRTDVAVLKTDVGTLRDQLGRLERATDSRFNRVDAQLERLITLVQRDETKRN
jgi:hypothetical protein